MDLEDTTSTTRYFNTVFGPKSYTEVADVIAEHLVVLLDEVAQGQFQSAPLGVELLRTIHERLLSGVIPDMAGRWRSSAVRVGGHYPPEHFHVDRMMRECFDNIESRLHHARNDIDLQVEALAYAEAEILHVHPFQNFNGRAVRVFPTEMIRRLDFPVTDLHVARDTQAFDAYVAALREYDAYRSLHLLCAFWREYRLA
ncbi:MAG TPA: Fic family protein [Aldersonia sp.]